MAAPVSRRQALGLLGAGAFVAVAAACGGSSSDSSAPATKQPPSSGSSSASGSASSSSTASCVLTPEMTEGPYYIDGEAVRSDITEGKPGTPLRLDLTVVDADACTPIPGATVEVWHADATGNYSGFGNTTSNRTFLRGIQTADDSGTVTFRTIYPGWYQGRAVHIHLKAHKGGGNEVHTTQLFFDESTSDAVFAASPYNTHGGRRTTNAQDGIYRDGGAQATPALTENGDGYVGTLTVGIVNSV